MFSEILSFDEYVGAVSVEKCKHMTIIRIDGSEVAASTTHKQS